MCRNIRCDGFFVFIGFRVYGVGTKQAIGWALRVPLFVSNSTRRAGSCLYIPVGRACAGRALQATHSNSLAARRGAV